MLKKILLAAAFTITPFVFADTASAQWGCAPYGAYRAPIYGAPVVPHHHRHLYRSAYRSPVGIYGSPYRSYRYGGLYGGLPYGSPYGVYRRGTAVGVGPGGFSLRIGF